MSRLTSEEWIVLGVAFVALALVVPSPRTIVIPDNEPFVGKLLSVWKGSGDESQTQE